MAAKLKTAVLGATGYSGLELARLLGRHPRTDAPLLLRRTAEKKTDDSDGHPPGLAHISGNGNLPVPSPVQPFSWSALEQRGVELLYCSSKAALHMLTKVIAKALAPEIAVNAVAPGMIDLGEKSAAAFMRKMAKQTPMRRNGTAGDIAAAGMFFAAAPQFITGQVLAVDGGLGL